MENELNRQDAEGAETSAKPLSEHELKMLRSYQAQALNHLHSLAHGETFRTSIPVQDFDSDVVIGNALHGMTSLFKHINALEAKLEKEREDWQDVQRRVQDANDKLRWREKDVERLRVTAQKVLADCKAVDVEPFGAAALRDVIADTARAEEDWYVSEATGAYCQRTTLWMDCLDAYAAYVHRCIEAGKVPGQTLKTFAPQWKKDHDEAGKQTGQDSA